MTKKKSSSGLPKALSPGEEEFALQCRVYGLEPVRELLFFDGRKWAFDFAWPDEGLKLAVEIEGGTAFGKSRHSQGRGFEDDARKYNTATLMGWRVLRFSTAMVRSAEAIDTVREVLNK